ncbi:hypothetical protein [Streptomyces massasporeus]|uniref:hypothetical protein n=1 Tax=Streptomyces massasporeus TaxID=67324 RepID=UPI0033E7854B
MSEGSPLYDDVLYRWEQLPAGTEWLTFAQVVHESDLAPYAYYFFEFDNVLAQLPADREDETLYRQDVVTRFVYWLAGEFGIYGQWPPLEQYAQTTEPAQAHQYGQAEQYGQADQYGQYGQADHYGQYAAYDPSAQYTEQAAAYDQYAQYPSYDQHAQHAGHDPYAQYADHDPYAGYDQEYAPEAEEPAPVDPAVLGELVEAVLAATSDSEAEGVLTEDHIQLIQEHGLSLEVDLDELPPLDDADAA